jgi:hypothetical protein
MRWMVLLLILVACTAEQDKPRVKRADRKASAEIAVSRTPVPRTYRIDGSELKVLDVPVMDSGGFVDMHRCFLWRDAEFKTATLSCSQDAEPVLSGPDPH